MKASAAAAVRLAGGVVGVAALFLPALAGSRYGASALAGWLFLWLAALALGATLHGLGRRRPEEPSVAAFAADAFGERWRAVVTSLYLTGFVVGQAVVGLVAGAYVAGASGGGHGTQIGVAAGTLAAAAALAARGRTPSPRLRLAIFAVVAALLLAAAGAWAARGAHLPASGTLSASRSGHAAFLLLFAFVGVEGAARLRPARGLVLSALVVALLYGGAALAGAAGRGSTLLGPLPGGDLPWTVVAVAVCVLLCAANLAAAAGMARTLAGEGVLPSRLARPRDGLALVTAAAGAALAVAWAAGLDVADLLEVPNSMALAIWLLAACVGLIVLAGGRRLLAGAALAAYAVLLPFAGWAVLLPLAVAAAASVSPRLLQYAAPGHLPE